MNDKLLQKLTLQSMSLVTSPERLQRTIAGYSNVGILLPGWTCLNPRCGVFNGAAVEVLNQCRCCGSPRPGSAEDLRRRPIDDLEISIRLHCHLQKHGCVTIGDAQALLDKPVWSGAKKSHKELREILVNIDVMREVKITRCKNCKVRDDAFGCYETCTPNGPMHEWETVKIVEAAP